MSAGGDAHPPYDEGMQRRAMTARPLWAFAPYAMLSAVHVVLLAVDSPAAGPTKILLMPLLAVPVVAFARHLRRSDLALLAVALLFSWLGDSAGAFFPDAPELPLMLGFFGLAHLAYIALFVRSLARRRLPGWTLVYAVWWVVMVTVLGPHAGGLLAALAVYGLVLGGTAALSARCTPVVTIGGAFFLTSDTLLALDLFLPEAVSPWASPVIMLTYTLGQGLIIAGAIAALTRRSIT